MRSPDRPEHLTREWTEFTRFERRRLESTASFLAFRGIEPETIIDRLEQYGASRPLAHQLATDANILSKRRKELEEDYRPAALKDRVLRLANTLLGTVAFVLALRLGLGLLGPTILYAALPIILIVGVVLVCMTYARTVELLEYRKDMRREALRKARSAPVVQEPIE